MAWSGKINGVTNPAKIMGIDVANIKSVMGVESSETWLNYTSDAYWSCLANCTTWNGSVWTESGPGLALQEAGTWNVDFRPTKLKVTYSGGGPATITLYYGGAPGDSDTNYTSGDEIPLTVTDDITRIDLYMTGTVSVIEFLD